LIRLIVYRAGHGFRVLKTVATPYIYRKLHVRSRTEAVVKYLRTGS
jgi:hypothetical protein